MAKDMLGVLIRKIVDLSLGALNVIYDLVEKLSGEAGQEWFAELKKFLRKENCWTGVINKFLKLISSGENLVLDPVDGRETLTEAKDVFSYIDSNFKNWDANEPGQPTAETPVDVYEVVKDGEFASLFGSLFGASPDSINIKEFIEKHRQALRKRCLIQAQIKNFVKKHRKWLRTDGYGTFFLFESNGHFFVAFTYVTSDGKLYVNVFQFEYSYVCYAGRHLRVVVPQLA